MKIKFVNPCKYKITYYRVDNGESPLELIENFNVDDQIDIYMILEDHPNCIDITYNNGIIALFGLKKSDFICV